MIERRDIIAEINTAVRRSPVTALLGPRQCGKTTVARVFSRDKPAVHFDLESFADRARLQNPEFVLRHEIADGRSLVVLDEIQLMPELFNVLRVLVDEEGFKGRFLVLGSASPHIVRGVSESLAGRVEFIELGGFSLQEVGPANLRTLWLRGGFPRSFLADSDADSEAWREGFIQTFLQRDVPQLGFSAPPAALRRLWTMLAHYHGQIFNTSDLGRAMDLSPKTVRRWVDTLAGTFMVRQLQPWFANLSKRQVRSPKVYVRDTGLLHRLLGVSGFEGLLGDPRVGASWEGMAIEQILWTLRPPEAYFWSTHSGAEIDLLVIRNGKRLGFEMKFSEAPRVTQSMRVATSDLELSHLWVIHAGSQRFEMERGVTALPLAEVASLREAIQDGKGT